jgi:hypothetical protein
MSRNNLVVFDCMEETPYLKSRLNDVIGWKDKTVAYIIKRKKQSYKLQVTSYKLQCMLLFVFEIWNINTS